MKKLGFAVLMTMLAAGIFVGTAHAEEKVDPCVNEMMDEEECAQPPIAVQVVNVPEEEKKLPDDPVPPQPELPAPQPEVQEQVPPAPAFELSGSGNVFGCSLGAVAGSAPLFSGLEFMLVGLTAWHLSRRAKRFAL